jgi:hypothetical protein
MDGKVNVNSIPYIQSLIQVVYLIIPVRDISGIECWVPNYSQLISV